MSPRAFIRYSTYKPVLQHEFYRVCVYCRMPDSTAPNIFYTVDHYKPKGLPEFSHLVCEYSNLYYCCHACNSRKSSDWPATPADPKVVNPCDDVMAAHLRFDAKTGRMLPLTDNGTHMEDLLQLNDDEVVKYRLSSIVTAKTLQRRMDELEIDRSAWKKALKDGVVPQTEFDDNMAEIDEELTSLRWAQEGILGTRKLNPLSGRRVVPGSLRAIP